MKTSIIISAYRAVPFLEKCLDSIIGQPHLHEILLTIDGCPETLAEVKRIKPKYGEKLKAYNSPENRGVYVQFNQLIKKATGDYIMFFGADDIMNDDMMEVLNKHKGNFDVVTFRCINFGDGDSPRLGRVVDSIGVRLFKASLFNIFGGFPEARHSMDDELMYRMNYFSGLIKTKTLPNVLFKRRIHDSNLTVKYPINKRDKSYKLKRYSSVLDLYCEVNPIPLEKI